MNFHYSNGSSKFKPGLQILVWLINGGGGGEEIAYINYLYYLTNVFFDLGFDPVPESQVCSVLQAFLDVVSWFVYLVERADVLALVACG